MRPKYSAPARNAMFCAQIFGKVTILFILGAGVLVSIIYFMRTPRYPLYAVSPRFPRKIWQTWKVDPTRFEENDMERSRTWTVLNPEHRYEVLTDGNALAWVEDNYGPSGLDRPDIVHVYRSLTTTILKADLIRYLIMYKEGGLYTDIDVEAVRPIESFIPRQYSEADIDMVIGIETDEPDFKDHPILGSKARSFVQWTFMCKPRLPVMMRLIEKVMASIQQLAERQKTDISNIVLSFDDVLATTGPSQFTSAVLTQMSKTVHNVSWDMFHDLQQSTLVARTLVLTSEAFAAGTGHSNSGNGRGRGAMVQHHYHASHWPSQHVRFLHPVFGNVEKCNWNRECIDLWDLNTAFFESLPVDQQLKMIEMNNKGPERMPDEMEGNLLDVAKDEPDAEQGAPQQHEPLSEPQVPVVDTRMSEERYNAFFGMG